MKGVPREVPLVESHYRCPSCGVWWVPRDRKLGTEYTCPRCKRAGRETPHG